MEEEKLRTVADVRNENFFRDFPWSPMSRPHLMGGEVGRGGGKFDGALVVDLSSFIALFLKGRSECDL
ncbi:unnamed protein product [Linum trigynum]|uniref:Uncharacterized protein n=1 Tax=Linum trigynum TaxID=586398 RepID=A0AAV2GSV3_9ROSI